MEKIKPKKEELIKLIDFCITAMPPRVVVKQMVRCLGFEWPDPDFEEFEIGPKSKPKPYEPE